MQEILIRERSRDETHSFSISLFLLLLLAILQKYRIGRNRRERPRHSLLPIPKSDDRKFELHRVLLPPLCVNVRENLRVSCFLSLMLWRIEDSRKHV